MLRIKKIIKVYSGSWFQNYRPSLTKWSFWQKLGVTISAYILVVIISAFHCCFYNFEKCPVQADKTVNSGMKMIWARFDNWSKFCYFFDF